MSMRFGNSVAIQWLELYTLTAEGLGSIPCQRIRIPTFSFIFFFFWSTSLPHTHKKMRIPFNPLIPLPEIFSKEIISSWQK